MRSSLRSVCVGFVAFAALLCTALVSEAIVAGDAEGATRLVAPGQQGQDVPDEYVWPPEQQRQREEAIRKRDSSLLPECTAEYYAWRAAAKAAGKLSDRPPSMEFWDRPGCRTRPDGGAWGPKSEPGPRPATTATPRIEVTVTWEEASPPTP